jgi:hypothetical protein
MMMTQPNGETSEREINAMSIVEAYKNFSTYIDELKERELYKDVRFGTNGIGFDLYDWANGRMRIKTKSGVVIYRGMTIKEEYLITELERRERIIKKHLIKVLFDKPTWLKPRGIEKVGGRS